MTTRELRGGCTCQDPDGMAKCWHTNGVPDCELAPPPAVAYYVVIRKGRTVGRLLGPFDDHTAAVPLVEGVAALARTLSPKQADGSTFEVVGYAPERIPVNGSLNRYFGL